MLRLRLRPQLSTDHSSCSLSPLRAWGCAHTQTHTQTVVQAGDTLGPTCQQPQRGPRSSWGCASLDSHIKASQRLPPRPRLTSTRKRPDLAPASGLGERRGGRSGCLDGQRVSSTPQDGDAQGRDQGPVRAQAQEPCRAGSGERLAASGRALRAGLSLILGDLSPSAPACTPWKPGPKRAQPWGLPRTAMAGSMKAK